MGTQHQALRTLGPKPFHDSAPEQTRCAQLGNLEIEIHPDGPEEAQATREIVDIQALCKRSLHILLTVGQGKRKLERLIGPRLLHVIPADRNRVKFRHEFCRVLDDVPNNPHARLGRINIGIADHELFQNIVLNRPTERRLIYTLLFGRHDVARKHWQHGAIHRHRDTNAVQRDAIEQNLHVLDGINRHTRLADITDDPGMVTVVTAMGCQIERHTDALPARRERIAVKAVAIFRG